MSATTNFMSRWSRLKHEAKSAPAALPDVEDGRKATVVQQAEANDARHENDEGALEQSSEEGLPSIDTIAHDTDIRVFLRGNVPADLTRAALRRAWTSDPAIRDFIGIAESQWDFSDPSAMPGFGPLSPTDNALALLEQAIGSCGSAAKTVAELADLDRQEKQGRPQITDADFGETTNERRSEDAATIDDRIEGKDVFIRPRHGGALPR